MILLVTSITLFNLIALKIDKRLTQNQIANIWSFTIAFQLCFDLIAEYKLNAYWYFNKGVDWIGILGHTILIPPVNIIFLSLFPFKTFLFKQAIYITIWTVGILTYEAVTLLPEPFGFFHLGKWKLWYDAFIVPILLLILLGYYKWICKLEKKLLNST
ncbi:hypothetical protein HPT25_22890 [Bacillus sp. BRMEA1]|nr:hypothetical protein [Neobacillus endophyticus]